MPSRRLRGYHVDHAVEHLAQRAYLNTSGRQSGGLAAHEDGQPVARSKRSLHVPFELIADHRCLLGRWASPLSFVADLAGGIA